MEKALMKAESGITRAKLATWATASGLLTVLSTTVLAYRNCTSDLMWNLVVSSGSVATCFSVVVVVEVVVVLGVVMVGVVVDSRVTVAVDLEDEAGIVLTSMHPSSSLLHGRLVVVTTSDCGAHEARVAIDKRSRCFIF
jgi:hypothetical protein